MFLQDCHCASRYDVVLSITHLAVRMPGLFLLRPLCVHDCSGGGINYCATIASYSAVSSRWEPALSYTHSGVSPNDQITLRVTITGFGIGDVLAEILNTSDSAVVATYRNLTAYSPLRRVLLVLDSHDPDYLPLGERWSQHVCLQAMATIEPFINPHPHPVEEFGEPEIIDCDHRGLYWCTGDSVWELEQFSIGGQYFYRWKLISSGCDGNCASPSGCHPRIPFALPPGLIDEGAATALGLLGMSGELFPGRSCACGTEYVPPSLPPAPCHGVPVFQIFASGVSGKVQLGWMLVSSDCDGACDTKTCVPHPPEEPALPPGPVFEHELGDLKQQIGQQFNGRCLCADAWEPPSSACPDCSTTPGNITLMATMLGEFEEVVLSKHSAQCYWSGYSTIYGADNEFRLSWASGLWTLVLYDTVNDLEIARWSGIGRSCDVYMWLTKNHGPSHFPAGLEIRRPL